MRVPWAGLLVTGTFGLLRWWECRRPLRSRAEPRPERLSRNLAVAALAGWTVSRAERPVTSRLTRWVERRGIGLVPRLPLPHAVRTVLALLLLDYTLYVWHVLTHRVPLLWRMHVVHHVDLDLDVSTAVRFHAAELFVSTAWRAAQIVLIGVSPRMLAQWQTLTLLSVLFHHSNVRLPLEVERWLCRVLVTPRMHGIHHSIVEEETNSNWSSGLTVWDWLHGTLRMDVPQEAITIGVPAYREPRDVKLRALLVLPFVSQRPTWRCPDAERPTRRAQRAERGESLRA